MGLVRKFRICGLGAVFILAVLPLKAQQDAHALVSRMVDNELNAQKHPRYWMFRQTSQKGGSTQVTEAIETTKCWLSWPVSYNGHPPTPEQQKAAKQELDRLVRDDHARRQNRAAIDQDARKSAALLRMLPDAFLFTSHGTQQGNIRLSFQPNPRFQPPSREAKVFHNMEGTLVINAKEIRLVSLSGRLRSDVTFGAGFLGRLHKGGTFHVEQTKVAPDDWETSLIDVHIAGRALLFHTISEQQHQINADFRPAPSDLSLAQAASMLEKKGEKASVSMTHCCRPAKEIGDASTPPQSFLTARAAQAN
ncbi:MAG TPA: hypothetical protein VL240_12640 [Candidatus Binatia bacterium]|nr:hypothetical protein [Candidatus Binatia bacterium]